MKEKSIGSLPGIPTLLGAIALMLAGVAALFLAIALTKSGTGGGGLFVASGVVLVAIGIHSLFESLSVLIAGHANMQVGLILALVIAINRITASSGRIDGVPPPMNTVATGSLP